MSESTPTRGTRSENTTGSEARAEDRRHRNDTAAANGWSRDSPAGAGTPAKTSVAAVFALVFGLMALLAALTGLLAPVAVVLGLIGLVLGVVGMKAGTKPRTTGKGVAIGGLVLAVLGLLIGIAALVGAVSVVSSNPQILDQIANLVNEARGRVGA